MSCLSPLLLAAAFFSIATSALDVSHDAIHDASHDAAHEAHLTGQVFVQGDMLLEPEQHRAAYRLNLDDPHSFAGAALESERKRWRGGVIPYTIDAGVSGATRRNFQWAAGIWNENTCIRILPAGSPGTEGIWGSIKVMKLKGCWATVGQRYSETKMSLGRGCEDAAAHELGHVIGLHHEQCRTDRDDFIKVIMSRVVKSQRYNFEIATGISNFSVPYDYCSIMHYGMKYFGMGKQITMLTKDPDHQLSIGNRGVPTFNDYKVVNIMYKCNAHCPPLPNCDGECYVNHKCQCKCPSPQDCPKRACADILPAEKCEYYATHYLCGDGKRCAKSCGVCDQVKKLREIYFKE